MAETLHDLAKNSMDSVGVSGAAVAAAMAVQEAVSKIAGLFSSMFSSLGNEYFEAHELMTILSTKLRQKKKKESEKSLVLYCFNQSEM